jgi:hypothetical protein
MTPNLSDRAGAAPGSSFPGDDSGRGVRASEAPTRPAPGAVYEAAPVPQNLLGVPPSGGPGASLCQTLTLSQAARLLKCRPSQILLRKPGQPEGLDNFLLPGPQNPRLRLRIPVACLADYQRRLTLKTSGPFSL